MKQFIKDKEDEDYNKFKVVELGSSFDLGEALPVTIGSFSHNFVMNELY